MKASGGSRRLLLTPASRLPALQSRLSSLGDRHADHAAPLRPGAIVVAHVGVAEQLTQYEPGVARALADAAIGDHVLVRSNALAAVDLSELLRTLEGAILIGRGRPGNALRAQHVAAPLRTLLRVTGHVQHLARVLGHGADVDQRRRTGSDLLQHIVAIGTDALVWLLRGVGRFRVRGDVA